MSANDEYFGINGGEAQTRGGGSPLTCICNLSLDVAIVPEGQRIATVTPIFKKRSRREPENDRPLSPASVPGKLVETNQR